MGLTAQQDEYTRVVQALKLGTIDGLERLTREIGGFPTGIDPLVGQPWIMAAIESGSYEAIDWMLRRPVDLAFRCDDGYTPLHAALERQASDRHPVLELLLQHGASVDLKGPNDWTPAHMAAALDDVEALRILVRYGADLSIRTQIDDYATPLEEARNLGKLKAAAYLEGHFARG